MAWLRVDVRLSGAAAVLRGQLRGQTAVSLVWLGLAGFFSRGPSPSPIGSRRCLRPIARHQATRFNRLPLAPPTRLPRKQSPDPGSQFPCKTDEQALASSISLPSRDGPSGRPSTRCTLCGIHASFERGGRPSSRKEWNLSMPEASPGNMKWAWTVSVLCLSSRPYPIGECPTAYIRTWFVSDSISHRLVETGNGDNCRDHSGLSTKHSLAPVPDPAAHGKRQDRKGVHPIPAQCPAEGAQRALG
ncbi:uncharacterized protein B0H64DRAFT_171281 [Chaetomium fimeti]|uniref:Uncharacterized protein n=1 Tax=Chaetomium fimeti TaxID=1854472 RepID=A0AAE0LT29_9PEZI|nr:hypothetical protein B0H64DRAFT_171281 [Chaetomium fimeti]